MKTSEIYGTILYDAKIKLIDFISLGGRVSMRFRKSIFGYHLQAIGKLASNDFQYQKKGCL